MNIVKVRLKAEGKIYTETLFFPDEYNFSKVNKDFENKISDVCQNSHFQDIEDVKITIKMEW